MKALTDSSSPIAFVPYSAVFDDSFEDMARRVPDISKIRRVVGYSPTVHLDEIIEKVVAYWQAERAAQAAAPPRHASPAVRSAGNSAKLIPHTPALSLP